MKFSELTKKAKLNAMNDYIDGWKVTHENDEITLDDSYKLCMDTNNDIEYNKDGTVIV